MRVYTTISGDAWDTIAKKAYGDETKIVQLMAANLPLLDIFIFPAGVQVNTPAFSQEQSKGDEPIWRN